MANAAVAIYYNPSDPPKSGSVSLTKIGSGTTNADGELALRLNLARSPGSVLASTGPRSRWPGAARSTITGTLRDRRFRLGPGGVTLRPPSERRHLTQSPTQTQSSSVLSQVSIRAIFRRGGSDDHLCRPTTERQHLPLGTPHVDGRSHRSPCWRTAPTRITRRPLAALLLATKSCPEKSPSETPGKLTRLPQADTCSGLVSTQKRSTRALHPNSGAGKLAVAPLSDGCGAAVAADMPPRRLWR